VSLSDKKFGMLTIISSPRPDVYKCRCKCGNVIELWYSQINNRVVLHCGCKDFKPRTKNAKYYRHHRFSYRKTPCGHGRRFASGEYHSYTNMIRRCYAKTKSGEYLCDFWGGKGIRVCDRWLDLKLGFKNFLDDLGPRPPGKSLDRVNPQDHYTPLNCKWGTASEQNFHQVRYMWKDETPPPVPKVGVMNEMVQAEFGSGYQEAF
jgi:hypothetical protein